MQRFVLPRHCILAYSTKFEHSVFCFKLGEDASVRFLSMINRFYARFYFDIGTVSEKMISRRNITKKFCFEHKQTLKLRSTKPSWVYNKSYIRVVRSWRTAHNRRLSSVSRSATLLEARAEELFLARNAVRSVHL